MMITRSSIYLLTFILSIFDIESMIRYGGLMFIILVVFGSTGLFFCFFLPTGAVLFTAGILASSGDLKFDIVTICILFILASLLGNITGYWFGWKSGRLLYSRKDSKFYKRQHLITAESFYKKYGWLALTLGLYLPIIRTFASIVAGLIGLNIRGFILLTFAGSVVWILSFVLTGYFIGSNPILKPIVKYIVIAFVVLITVPLIIWVIKELSRLRKINDSKKAED